LCHQESTNPPESREWNTIAHLNDYEGRPEARAFTREEMQRFLDYADDQVERAVRAKRKGALAAYRDATIFKVIYGGIVKLFALVWCCQDWSLWRLRRGTRATGSRSRSSGTRCGCITVSR
jgi:hypothetical protein